MVWWIFDEGLVIDSLWQDAEDRVCLIEEIDKRSSQVFLIILAIQCQSLSLSLLLLAF